MTKTHAADEVAQAQDDQALAARESRAAELATQFRDAGLAQQTFVLIGLLTDILAELRRLNEHA